MWSPILPLATSAGALDLTLWTTPTSASSTSEYRPAKQGDYAYLLHIVRSLKSHGKGACILPHGVLFRGNVEGDIRRNLIHRGYIKGIIGLPANLFYGTSIPACIVVVDKEGAATRQGIFMIDASKGFIKDGPKNRLREMDVHKIVDVFNKQTEQPKYSRMVSFQEIEKNEFNLNIPRYIDSQEAEDVQDIEGGQPFVIHHQRLNFVFSEPGVLGQRLGIEMCLSVFDSLYSQSWTKSTKAHHSH